MSKVHVEYAPGSLNFVGPISVVVTARWPGGRGICSPGLINEVGAGQSLTVVAQSVDSVYQLASLSLGGPTELADQGDVLIDLPEATLTFTLVVASGSSVGITEFCLLQID